MNLELSLENQRQVIQGAGVKIEVIVNHAKGCALGEEKGVLLICHPHPLMGGTMDNKVAYTLARAGNEHGLLSVRFNFRGVGQSTGEHDKGVAEAQDVAFLLDALAASRPGLPIHLAGFSFGGFVAASVSQNRADLSSLILVAPAVTRFDLAEVSQFQSPLWVTYGLEDEVVEPDAMKAWYDAIETQKSLLEVPECGHFYHKKLADLKRGLLSFWGSLEGVER
jgi:alpha/beta superfamily hydrolase